MRKIWLVRHGESMSQTGETDELLNPDLSERGREQAARLVERLQGLDVDCALISPLKRATLTYELSGVVAGAPRLDSRVIESDWGIPDRYAPMLPPSPPPVAEPDRHDAWLQPVQRRTADLVAEIAGRTDGNVMLFGHWGVFDQFLATFSGMKGGEATAQATMDNAAVSLLEVDDTGNRFIRYWNDRAHVKDLLT